MDSLIDSLSHPHSLTHSLSHSCTPPQAEARLDDNELALAPAPSRLHDTVGKARVDSTYVSQVGAVCLPHCLSQCFTACLNACLTD